MIFGHKDQISPKSPASRLYFFARNPLYPPAMTSLKQLTLGLLCFGNALVVFSSDNGPVWYDVDTQKFSHDSSGGLRGMKADAWEAGHRMSFIIRWPAAIKEARTVNHTICFTDLFATLADLTGASLPVGQAPDSESFLPILKW